MIDGEPGGFDPIQQLYTDFDSFIQNPGFNIAKAATRFAKHDGGLGLSEFGAGRFGIIFAISVIQLNMLNRIPLEKRAPFNNVVLNIQRKLQEEDMKLPLIPDVVRLLDYIGVISIAISGSLSSKTHFTLNFLETARKYLQDMWAVIPTEIQEVLKKQEKESNQREEYNLLDRLLGEINLPPLGES